MSWIDQSYLLTGMVLCLVVGSQFAVWSSRRWQIAKLRRAALEEWQASHRKLLDDQAAGTLPRQAGGSPPNGNRWNGWRQFRVSELRRETSLCRSVYLVPADGKSVPGFQAGQYLTIRFHIPGESRPQVRCYSLSGPPDRLPYRITVKQVNVHTGAHPRSVSTYIHTGLRVGDLLDVKAPAGDFVLREGSRRPIVLLAGGVGITPLYSMLTDLLERRRQGADDQPVVLFYGNTHSGEVIFARELAELAARHPRLVIVNCLSRHRAGDPPGPLPCHYREHVSVSLIHRLLSTLDAEYYLCGPPLFLQSLQSALLAAGVDGSQLHSEAFGPASRSRANPPHPLGQEAAITETLTGLLAFTRSRKQVECPAGKSILEVAEDLAIPIDSGCRAGNCRTCTVRVLKGSVRHLGGHPVGLEPGTCLACIAQPQGEVQVEA
jgi:ferredoxin-NADP reductase